MLDEEEAPDDSWGTPCRSFGVTIDLAIERIELETVHVRRPAGTSTAPGGSARKHASWSRTIRVTAASAFSGKAHAVACLLSDRM